MKERPILFSAPMVRAILDGRKTQTRRVDKYMAKFPPAMPPELGLLAKSKNGEPLLTAAWDATNGKFTASFCPYGKPGDRLWVRETWRLPSPRWDGPALFPFPSDISRRYEADEAVSGLTYRGEWGKGRPSIHLPRKLSRINLEITGVRVERLNDISDVDALAEGVSPDMDIKWQSGDDTPRGMFGELWESINGPGSWDENPWVWVIEFRKI